MGKGVLSLETGPFPRVDGQLHCGGRPLAELAEEHGTPLYVYSGDRILQRLAEVREAFRPLDPLIAYSVKANPNLAVLRLLAKDGAGADIVSGGELFRVVSAGVPGRRIVFAGVGKTRDEMAEGLRAGIRAFHVESSQELDILSGVARDLGVVAPFGVRVNPSIPSPTHEYTQTGHAAAKFGVTPEEALDLYRRAGEGALRAVGIAVHIGSQIRETKPFLQALEAALPVLDRVREELGVDLEYVDLGGGFGIADFSAADMDVASLGAQVVRALDGSGLELILEPGRYLVGDAGVLLTRVLYVKRGPAKTFVITDAGMTDLIRPSHYGGLHPISLAVEENADPRGVVDVVGPVCETGDFLARDREMPVPEPGALLCIHGVGAYGFTMASNYNSRPRSAEVLVMGDRARLVRERETYADLVRGEVDPEGARTQ